MPELRMTRDEVAIAVAELVRRGRPTGSDCTLDSATMAAFAAHAAEEVLTAAVVTARRRGHSWAEIGAALGVSRQSAWERFGAVAGGPGTGKRCRRARGSDDGGEPCPRCDDAGGGGQAAASRAAR